MGNTSLNALEKGTTCSSIMRMNTGVGMLHAALKQDASTRN